MSENDVFDVDAWLDQLENDRPKSSGRSLIKLLMNTKDNKGNIIFVPFKDQKSKNFYTKLAGVREYKMYNENSEMEVWHKILPKEVYGTLSETDSQLYDEVVAMFDDLNEKAQDYTLARMRSYAFFYGYIIDHTNETGKTVTDSISKPALIEFPSLKIISALVDTIQAKTKSLKSKEWIPIIFNNNETNREGMVSIKISGGQGGYDFTVNLEIQNAYSKVIPDNFDASEFKPLFKDAISDFLGWQNGPDSYFNQEMFEAIRANLLTLLNEDGAQASEVSEQTEEGPKEPQPTNEVPVFNPNKPF